jgi:hypothetical protein
MTTENIEDIIQIIEATGLNENNISFFEKVKSYIAFLQLNGQCNELSKEDQYIYNDLKKTETTYNIYANEVRNNPRFMIIDTLKKGNFEKAAIKANRQDCIVVIANYNVIIRNNGLTPIEFDHVTNLRTALVEQKKACIRAHQRCFKLLISHFPKKERKIVHAMINDWEAREDLPLLRLSVLKESNYD